MRNAQRGLLWGVLSLRFQTGTFRCSCGCGQKSLHELRGGAAFPDASDADLCAAESSEAASSFPLGIALLCKLSSVAPDSLTPVPLPPPPSPSTLICCHCPNQQSPRQGTSITKHELAETFPPVCVLFLPLNSQTFSRPAPGTAVQRRSLQWLPCCLSTTPSSTDPRTRSSMPTMPVSTSSSLVGTTWFC